MIISKYSINIDLILTFYVSLDSFVFQFQVIALKMFGNNFGSYANVECGLIWNIPATQDDSDDEGEGEPPRTTPVPLVSVNILAAVVHAVA